MGTKSDLRACSEAACRDIEATRRSIEIKARALRNKATPRELVRPLTDRLSNTLGEGGGKILDAFRDNPIPLTLAGIGLGWLILKDLRRAAPEPGIAQEAVPTAAEEGAAGKVTEKVGHVAAKAKEAAKEGLQKTSDWFSTTLEENPMVLAVGALAIGIVAGLVVPVSHKEVETAGKVGEKLAEAVLEKGNEVLEKVPAPSEGMEPVAAAPEPPGPRQSPPSTDG